LSATFSSRLAVLTLQLYDANRGVTSQARQHNRII
jgi:hypothetical protein